LYETMEVLGFNTMLPCSSTFPLHQVLVTSCKAMVCVFMLNHVFITHYMHTNQA